MCEIGQLLRNARLEAGLSLSSIADELCIRAKFLQAIESGDLEQLPGGTFTLGFVRAYADHLGLDCSAVVEAYKAELGVDIVPSCGEGVAVPAELFMTPKSSFAGGFGAALIGLAGIAAIWWIVGQASPEVDSGTGFASNQPVMAAAIPVSDQAKQPASEKARITPISSKPLTAKAEDVTDQQAAPSGSAIQSGVQSGVQAQQTAVPAAATPSPSVAGRIVREVFPSAQADLSPTGDFKVDRFLSASDDIWLSVTRIDGTVIWSGVLREGENYPLNDTMQVFVTTGNAGALNLVSKSDGVRTLGARGASLVDHRIAATTTASSTPNETLNADRDRQQALGVTSE